MSQQLYSVDQVASLLALHAKTVRAYIRGGRLKATRVGKQYRITQEDLEAFTGTPPPALGQRTRHAEVSSIVQIDAISFEAMSRLSTMIIGMASSPYDGERVRVETVHDGERANMKIIMVGGLAVTADLLKIINTMVEQL